MGEDNQHIVTITSFKQLYFSQDPIKALSLLEVNHIHVRMCNSHLLRHFILQTS